ncbi:dihydrolipoyl dehydrogenase [Alicyclobacillus fastidiosus]|uniref:Dihydrolipoyl dehydrogenase n=1 Tax=Alicyclobacillus fastidiosus TaxID=392011 RepID=A0ABY6ZGR8_9BACL|nr:dihydrolipoyl dehydrogenase [Alicyclobacillus fastidiosus]WAH41291.1 dihydrolipoyl dehydrogenase [Alicyclobacillus fastidiosus]GMA62889.1 dihydrolipoyl dehydrogenase [Alicyclobacillus fastidiosus]
MNVVIIGGGPGGYTAALQAANHGLSVTLVERGGIGGTCLNVGCIPTKSLLETASSWSKAVYHGWLKESTMPDSHWQEAQKQKQAVVKQLTTGVKTLLKGAGVRTVTGTARFVSENEVIVEDEGVKHSITFDRVIIATGSRVSLPQIDGADQPGVYTSDSILAIEQIPRRLVIVGGGVIGLEFASLFQQLATHVDIVEFTDEILPRFDVKTVTVLKRLLLMQGISFHTRSTVQRIERSSTTRDLKVIVRGSNDALFSLDADAVLLAVGRSPNTDSLHLEKIGVQTDRERILVNQHCQSSAVNVYAIGDCSNPVMLAHAAMSDAHAAVDHIVGHAGFRKSRFLIPQCIYSQPELASVGMTEEEAKQAGVLYEVSEVRMTANGKALVAETDGVCRILSEQGTGMILGVHMVGPHVTELIQEATLALELEATVRELVQTIHAHPTVSEVIHEAALVTIGHPVHVPKKRKEGIPL